MLQIFLPLNKDLTNLGLDKTNIVSSGAELYQSSYVFDGTNSFISLSNLNKYFVGGTNSFSICFWMKHLGNNRRGVIFGNYGLTGASRPVNIEITASNTLRFYWGGSPDYSSTVTIMQNTWNHYSIVYNGSSLKVYKDGDLAFTQNVTLSTSTDNSLFYLGRDSRTGSTAFYGNLSDFRIYDHALSVKEIRDLSAGLVAHYKLDDRNVENTANILNKVAVNNARLAAYKNGIEVLPIAGDAYCSLVLKSALVVGTVYTLSFDVTGIDSNDVINYGFYYNSKMNYVTRLKNGRNIITFTAEVSQSTMTFDDSGRVNDNSIYLTNFQLEQKDHATPYCKTSRTNYEIVDYSGYRNNLTSVGSFTVDSNTSRYDCCTKFTTGTYAKGTVSAREIKSFSLWTYIGASNPANSILFSDHDSTLAMGFYGGNIVLGCKTARTYSVYSLSSIGLKYNSWNHFAANFINNSSYEFFVNGVQVSALSSTDTWTTSLSGFYIGNRHTLNMQYNGNISDLRLYSSILTSDFISDLYNVAASIDKEQNCHVYGIEELDDHTITQISKKGLFKTLNFEEDDNIIIGKNTTGFKQIYEI